MRIFLLVLFISLSLFGCKKDGNKSFPFKKDTFISTVKTSNGPQHLSLLLKFENNKVTLCEYSLSSQELKTFDCTLLNYSFEYLGNDKIKVDLEGMTGNSIGPFPRAREIKETIIIDKESERFTLKTFDFKKFVKPKN